MYNETMNYKVFLVEDEIITREGIRDNVDWGAAGFEFCGEAPNGEIALPLIEEAKPDVLITDIKMPFMDGLQLSKIVREHMPWIKVIILSGHDEFNYAQSAVKLGITEYLLKPISAGDLKQVLIDLAAKLDQEKQAREKLKKLEHKVENTLALTREKFLLQLVMGGISSVEAFEQSRQLGLALIAKHYLVILIKIELCDKHEPFDYQLYQEVEKIVSEFAGNNLDIFLTKKDFEELVLLLKGESPEQLVQEGAFLGDLLKKEIEKRINCRAIVELGRPQDRLGNIHRSFAEALAKSKATPPSQTAPPTQSEPVEILKIDHAAIENYLKFGDMQDFEPFFAAAIAPAARLSLQSYVMKHYMLVDIILTVAQFISNLGEQAEAFSVDLQKIENTLNDLDNMEKIKAYMQETFATALASRSDQTNRERSRTLQHAKTYLEENFSNPDLKMSRVAELYNITPSYFSTIFSQEMGEPFKDYLAKLRIGHAKELLVTTNLKCATIAYQSGYNDSHYFSFVFKKKTGLSPQKFREQFKENKNVE